MKKNRTLCFVALGFLASFVLWTALVCRVDVEPIGPHGSKVGFSAFNQAVHASTGCNMTLYNVTDWLGLVPIAVCLCFGTLGMIQWIRRKSLLQVDRDLLALGIFYAVVIGVFFLFEKLRINYRPVLINGILEASYPSSTTLLCLCVMPTAWIQIQARCRRRALRHILLCSIAAFTAFMVVGRWYAGVHWATDIFASLILSASLLLLFFGGLDAICKKEKI